MRRHIVAEVFVLIHSEPLAQFAHVRPHLSRRVRRPNGTIHDVQKQMRRLVRKGGGVGIFEQVDERQPLVELDRAALGLALALFKLLDGRPAIIENDVVVGLPFGLIAAGRVRIAQARNARLIEGF